MPAADGISAEEVRAELEMVLSAPAFSRSPRLGRLLSYLCTRTLEGEADQIKEYTIGIDVMDRPASFDPTKDAIARVEVHRLRKRLKEYYENEGATNRLRIVVPNGQYAPTFTLAANGASANGGPPAPRKSDRRLWMVLAAVVIVAAGWSVALLTRGPRARQGAREAVMALPASPAVRLACGQRQGYIDRAGRQWLADQYFSGGTAIDQPRRYLARALDARVFDSLRAGDFSYDIPLAAGTYELHLYFVETAYGPGAPGGGGEISRIFDVFANGRPILTRFDIVSDAGGPFIADVRAFKDIAPAADGKLHLRFRGQRELARVSAIEIVPARPHLLNPVRLHFDDNPYTDFAGAVWMPAAYWSGGQLSRHTLPVSGTRDPELYAVERFGHFSLAIPADRGSYQVSLHFVEEFFGQGNPAGTGGAGSRVFNVFGNGGVLLERFDIFKEAGINHVLIKTFHGLKPNAQGKLVLDFVPVEDYASLYAVEVLDEGR